MSFDWKAHAKHRAQVIRDEGQWVGLADNEGVPIMDMAPIISLDAPRARMQVTDLELTISVRSQDGVVHPIVDELVGDGMAHVLDTDGDGRMSFAMDETRFVVVERDGLREAYYVVLCVAKGDAESPQQITIKGVSVLDVLGRFPCPSYRGSWKNRSELYQWRRFEYDWSADEHATQRFKTPRLMRPLELATRTDGFAHQGRALTTLHKILRDSVAAAYVAVDIAPDRRPLLVEDLDPAVADDTPNIIVAPRDKSLWDDLGDVARAAGVEFLVRLWWPGDSNPRGLRLAAPQLIVTVTKTGEVST
ncbi:hypothetical protein C1Y63_10615 [Corynebacterium sp. 13CS0277]|uniref:hypothetical protein n=1 Tax=Corynebacterium sp. 13CS0277 TaxID=2071994 RepID=UPI000D02D5C8|nr:hypothetical protein [Corynebacterium sp. 13CS0277]PRQ10638.1 hypothetical protein C1Y63_10615 [Corynebacterium sp. 13CS0277]